MKKIIFVSAALLLCAPAFAQLAQGQHLMGGRLGLGFQLENSGVSYPGDNRVDWGTLGVEYDLSYYYLVTEHIGLGTEVSYGNFEGGTLFVSSDKVDDRTHFVNAMLATRLTANPSNLFRLYMPLGVGLTVAQQRMRIKKHGVDYTKRATDTSLGFFVGAGFEFDLGRDSGWAVGLETRYNAFHYDTEKLTRNAPAGVTGHGNRRMSYISFHLQINKHF